MMNFRKNSIALSGTFSAVGHASTGAVYGISGEVSTIASTLDHGNHR